MRILHIPSTPPLSSFPLQAALDNLRWGADYLMACHTQPDAYVAQIGEPGAGEMGVVLRLGRLSAMSRLVPACCVWQLRPPSHPTDHAYWGRPEEQSGARPAYTWGPGKPASDAAGAAASALAATSLLLRPSDPSYAAACLDHARSLFALASQVGGWDRVVGLTAAAAGGWVHGQDWPLLSLPAPRSANRSELTALPPHTLHAPPAARGQVQRQRAGRHLRLRLLLLPRRPRAGGERGLLRVASQCVHAMADGLLLPFRFPSSAAASG